jgi:hypothetical protein
MKEEEAKITMYKISACGYYKRGDPEAPQFGSLSETLRDLRHWIAGKLLRETKTYTADADERLPTYVVDVTECHGDWLLTLWNELATTDGKVASIDGLAQVGRANVTMTEFEAGSIPGFATYFWFMPDIGLMATIRFQHATGGQLSMNKYLKYFLSQFSTNVVLAEEDNEQRDINIVGYRASPSADVTNFKPQFKTDLLRKPGPIDFLLERAERVRKVSKKEVLKIAERPKRVWWQAMLVNLHLQTPTDRPHEVKVNYEVEVDGLSKDQLQTIVDAWQTEDQYANNYGFDLKGESGKTYWLDHAFVKDSVTINVHRQNDEIVAGESLLAALRLHRQHLLGLVNA